MEDIKNINLSRIEELMRRFVSIKTEESKFRNHMAIIVDNNDPEKLGRCKVRVRNMMESLLDSDLPWAIPNPTFLGSMEGNFIVPPNGALVNIIFRNADLNFPEYTTMVIDSNNLPDERIEDYPDTLVLMKTDDGLYATYNRKTKEFVFRHSAGPVITFDKNGDIVADNRFSNTGRLTIKCLGRITVNGPVIELPQGMVIPNPNGGPFQSMKVDPLTGLPSSGNIHYRQGL